MKPISSAWASSIAILLGAAGEGGPGRAVAVALDGGAGQSGDLGGPDALAGHFEAGRAGGVEEVPEEGLFAFGHGGEGGVASGRGGRSLAQSAPVSKRLNRRNREWMGLWRGDTPVARTSRTSVSAGGFASRVEGLHVEGRKPLNSNVSDFPGVPVVRSFDLSSFDLQTQSRVSTACSPSECRSNRAHFLMRTRASQPARTRASEFAVTSTACAGTSPTSRVSSFAEHGSSCPHWSV
jgi:hypothetical protein